jgi:hypothetical protein
VGIIKAKWIIVPIFFLSQLNACGGSGSGWDISFTMDWSVALGDFNGDGYLDLAVARVSVSGPPPHPGHVAVYLQDPANPGVFSSPKNYNVGGDPEGNIAVSDLNNDGKLDLVVPNSSTNDVSILLQDAAIPGSFLPAVNYPCGTHPDFVAVGDLNADGRPDITVAISGGVAILFQDPAKPGSFLPAMQLTTPSGTSSVAIGDLNGDGKDDLVATSYNSGTIFIFFQNPTSPGTFLPAIAYGGGPHVESVVIQDINADGLLDLVVVNIDDARGGGIMIRLQDPAHPGQFPAAANYASAKDSSSVAVGDLNGDGRPDLAVAAAVPWGPAYVQTFLQDAGRPGTFLMPQSFRAGGGQESIAVGDLNGDGKPDLAVNNHEGSLILFQDPSPPGIFAEGVVIPLH